MRWFRRKPRNRRLSQRNVLDVKLSTAQVRQHRFRVLFYTSTVSLAVVLGIYVCWRAGDSLLNRLVYENPDYGLRSLDIQTDGILATEQIRRWAGVKEGDNLFALDLARIKRDLELIPCIQSVAAERVLPGTLRIHIQEREPVAQIVTTVMQGTNAAQSVVFLLGADGYVMLPVESQQRAVPPSTAERYATILGVSPAQLSPGRPVESPQIRAALRLITAFEHSPMAGLVELKQIDVASPDVLLVGTEEQAEVAVRTSELERQLNRWRLVYDLGIQQGRQIGSLDLSVMENIPLRWQEANALPPSSPKVRKTSPYKKKHV
jgi:hypothetical protein